MDLDFNMVAEQTRRDAERDGVSPESLASLLDVYAQMQTFLESCNHSSAIKSAAVGMFGKVISEFNRSAMGLRSAGVDASVIWEMHKLSAALALKFITIEPSSSVFKFPIRE